jgi:hypothetical protein
LTLFSVSFFTAGKVRSSARDHFVFVLIPDFASVAARRLGVVARAASIEPSPRPHSCRATVRLE